MTQEDKDLLLQNLCARLPYGVKVQTTYIMKSGERKDIGIDILTTVEISMLIEGAEEHKPYLFPLSSMTEEQIEEAKTYFWKDVDYGKSLVDKGINCFYPCFNILEFYHKNHFDYRGLIEKGLAIDCTNLNIY